MNPENYDWVPITVLGQEKWLRVPLNGGCAVEPGTASTLDIFDAFPGTPPGFQVKTRDCGPAVEVFAVADNIDRSGGSQPGPDPGQSSPDAEQYVKTFTSNTGSDGGPYTN